MTSITLPLNNSQIVKQISLKCNHLGVEGGDFFTSKMMKFQQVQVCEDLLMTLRFPFRFLNKQRLPHLKKHYDIVSLRNKHLKCVLPIWGTSFKHVEGGFFYLYSLKKI
jgi:hypothetical protein